MIIEFEEHLINVEHIVMVTPVYHSTFESGLIVEHIYFELHCTGKKTVFEEWIERSDGHKKEVERFCKRRENLIRLWKKELHRQRKIPFKKDMQDYDKYRL